MFVRSSSSNGCAATAAKVAEAEAHATLAQ